MDLRASGSRQYLQTAVWVCHNLHRGHIASILGALALQECGFLLIDVNLKLLLSVALHMQQTLQWQEAETLALLWGKEPDTELAQPQRGASLSYRAGA